MKKLICLFVTYSLCANMVALARNDASLNQAIISLNARARSNADKKLVLKAVSQQTRLPEKTLQSQMSATHLGYGELLTANSIAEGSGRNLNAVLAMKGTKSWASLSKQLRVVDGEATMVPRQAALREIQCVASSDGRSVNRSL